jgi:hypothetical protein
MWRGLQGAKENEFKNRRRPGGGPKENAASFRFHANGAGTRNQDWNSDQPEKGAGQIDHGGPARLSPNRPGHRSIARGRQEKPGGINLDGSTILSAILPDGKLTFKQAERFEQIKDAARRLADLLDDSKELLKEAPSSSHDLEESKDSTSQDQITRRILELHVHGKTAKNISNTLASEGMIMDWQKIRSIIASCCRDSSQIEPLYSPRPEVEPGISRFKGPDCENRATVNEYILEMTGKGLSPKKISDVLSKAVSPYYSSQIVKARIETLMQK